MQLAADDVLASVEDAIARASQGGARLASVTVPVEDVDPSAVVLASRLADDRWFCWEQPEGEFALAALGSAHEVISRGAERFAEVARDCGELIRTAERDEPDGLPAGAGPVWT